MYQFKGRAYYEEFHEREWDPDFEDRDEVEQEQDEDDEGEEN